MKLDFAKLKSHPLYKTETLLILAAVCFGLVSSLIKKGIYDDQLSAVRDTYKTVPILVAGKDLNPADKIDEKNLSVRFFLKKNISSNMILAQDRPKIIGSTVKEQIKGGDPMLLSLVIDKNGLTSMSDRIPFGKRFFTLEIKDKAISNGWIKPNDHVDIVVTMNLPNKGETTFNLLEDITLVSVGNKTAWGDFKTGSAEEIGFYVSPEEFNLLKFAEKKARFEIALRNPEEIGMKKTGEKLGVNLEEFLNSEQVKKADGANGFKINIKK
ncbi:MAG: Flp pilus assembly protein CpaB [Deltaproteobacteria bacterium]|nr:MAG: Flp pilus assembly protein CpaB [Deltaproteobacteria bacterium]